MICESAGGYGNAAFNPWNEEGEPEIVKNLSNAEPLKLDDGSELAVRSLDIDGNKVFPKLLKDGQVADSRVIIPANEVNDTFVYTRSGTSQRIVLHIRNAFRGAARDIISVDRIEQTSEIYPHRILLNDSSLRTIISGTPLKLEEGYEMAIKSIDIDGNRAYLELLRDGQVVDSQVIIAANEVDDTFIYSKLKTTLKLQLQGAVAQVDAAPEKILELQFNATSVEKYSGSYTLTVPGRLKATLLDDLGYSGSSVVERDNDTKVTIIASPEMVIAAYLRKNLDADVQIVGMAPVLYEIGTNVTRESLDALLAPVGGKVPVGEDAFVLGVTPETVDETKRVLESKLNRLGLMPIEVRAVDKKYILINLSGWDAVSAQGFVGEPGKFEIRIQTENNQSMHVLYGDAVESAERPKEDRSGGYGVPFTLSEAGAAALQKAAIDSGATERPQDHFVSMYLDKDEIFSAPLSPDLASRLQKVPSRKLEARVGSGDDSFLKSREFYIHLREGALPVNVVVVESGRVLQTIFVHFKNAFRGADKNLVTLDNIQQTSGIYPSRILINDSQSLTLTSGTLLELEEGYGLMIESLDIDGNKIYVKLFKDGQIVDSKVIVPANEVEDTFVFNKQGMQREIP